MVLDRTVRCPAIGQDRSGEALMATADTQRIERRGGNDDA
jgi:hypothetical protein